MTTKIKYKGYNPYNETLGEMNERRAGKLDTCDSCGGLVHQDVAAIHKAAPASDPYSLHTVMITHRACAMAFTYDEWDAVAEEYEVKYGIMV